MIEARLKDILEENINCQFLDVTNQSHFHEGHAGSPGTGQSHFKITIISDEFVNQPRVERQRRIYSLITPLFQQGLHAIEVSLYTEKEYVFQDKS